MAQLQPLNLRITGNANGLSAELGKAEGRVKGFSGFMDGQSKALLGVFAGLGVAGVVKAGFDAAIAGVETAIATVRALAGELDKIADKSDVAAKLGLSFKDLSGLEFSLGELSGLDGGTVQGALQKLLIGLEEAKSGAGKTKEVLDALGLDAGQLLKAGPLSALMQIADATKRLNDPTAQLGIAYDLFGRNATQLVNALRAGGDAIEDSYNFGAKWLGLTEQQVAASAAASDQWARLGVIVEGVVQFTAAEFAPLLKILLDDVIAIAEGWGGMNTILKETVTFTAMLVGFLKDYTEFWTTGYKIIAAQIGTVSILPELDTRVGTFDGKTQTLGDALGRAISFDQSREMFSRIESERAGMQDFVDRNRAALDQIELNRLGNAEDAGGPNSTSATLLQAQQRSFEQQREEAKRQDERQKQQMAKFDDAVERVIRGVRSAVMDIEQPIPVDL